MRDALRLSRAMTFKAAVADLALGGGKGVIALREGTVLGAARRRAMLADFGDLVESLNGRFITAEDVGVSSRDMAVVAKRTRHVAGLSRRLGGSGDPSPLTALGVEVGIRVSLERAFGTAALLGRSVGVIGLGHVGSRLARRCVRAGATVLAGDIDPAKQALAERLGARWTAPDALLTAPIDVLAPCALGGIIDDRTAAELQCPVVAGAANNQLTDERVADLLAARSILWAPDFVVNAGGLINIAVELEGYDAQRARQRVRAIGDTLRGVYDRAEASAVTPLTAAAELARARLAEGRG
jgi:leucine dehydrogenase